MARRYGGAVSVDLGSYADLSRSVVTKDVLLGVGMGIVGAAAAAFGLKKARSMVNPIGFLAVPAGTDYLKMALPAIGGAGLGFGAWMYNKKKNRNMGYAHLLGAAAAGLALAVWPKVAEAVGFAGVVGLDIPYGGFIVDDSAGESNQSLHGFGGLIVDDNPSALRGYADRGHMGRLAAASLDPEEDYSEMGRLAQFANYRELDVDGQG